MRSPAGLRASSVDMMTIRRTSFDLTRHFSALPMPPTFSSSSHQEPTNSSKEKSAILSHPGGEQENAKDEANNVSGASKIKRNRKPTQLKRAPTTKKKAVKKGVDKTKSSRIKLMNLKPSLHERVDVENWVECASQDVEIRKLEKWFKRLETKLYEAAKKNKTKTKKKGIIKNNRPLFKECQQLVSKYTNPVPSAGTPPPSAYNSNVSFEVQRLFWDMLLVSPKRNTESPSLNKKRLKSSQQKRDSRVFQRLEQYSNDHPLVWSRANQHKKKLRAAASKGSQPTIEEVPWRTIVDIKSDPNAQADGKKDVIGAKETVTTLDQDSMKARH